LNVTTSTEHFIFRTVGIRDVCKIKNLLRTDLRLSVVHCSILSVVYCSILSVVHCS